MDLNNLIDMGARALGGTSIGEKAAYELWKRTISSYSPEEIQGIIQRDESIVARADCRTLHRLGKPHAHRITPWIESGQAKEWLARDRPDLMTVIQIQPNGEEWLEEEMQAFKEVIEDGTVPDKNPASV